MLTRQLSPRELETFELQMCTICTMHFNCNFIAMFVSKDMSIPNEYNSVPQLP
jgi:hypothetical protein